MTSTVTSWTDLCFTLLASRVTYPQHREKVSVRLLGGRSPGQRLPPEPLVLDARDGWTFLFRESIVVARTIA